MKPGLALRQRSPGEHPPRSHWRSAAHTLEILDELGEDGLEAEPKPMEPPE